MQSDVFNEIRKNIKKNNLSDTQIAELQKATLDEGEALLLASALLLSARRYPNNNILTKEKLKLSLIKIKNSLKAMKVFNALDEFNFSQYQLNIFESIFPAANSKKIKKFNIAILDAQTKFNQLTEDSASSAKLISDSILYEAEKDRDIRIFNIIEEIEQMLIIEKNITSAQKNEIQNILTSLKAYLTESNHIKLNEIKKKLISDNHSHHKDIFEKILRWVKCQEIELCRRRGIYLSYLGIPEITEKILLSNQLSEAQKHVILDIQSNLSRYIDHPNHKTLQKIKNKVRTELEKLPSQEQFTSYRNYLKNIRTWAEFQEDRKKSDLLYFTKLQEDYEELQKHGELILPLDQGFDTKVGSGSCGGYVVAWAVGLLEGEKGKSVFGVKPNDTPLFKIANYDKVGLNMPELNQVFPATAYIDKLQLTQWKNPNKSIKRQKEGNYSTFTNKEKTLETAKQISSDLIRQAEQDSNPNKVYFITLWGENKRIGHAIGLWRTETGTYHFLDANYGWFRFNSSKEFKEWFSSYFPISKYGECFESYIIDSYSLKPTTLKEHLKTFFYNFYKVASLFIKNNSNSTSSKITSDKITEDIPSTKDQNSIKGLALENRSKKAVLKEYGKKAASFIENNSKPASSKTTIEALIDKPINKSTESEKRDDTQQQNSTKHM